VIRIRHEALPSGLSAVVRRRPGGDTDVVVSTVLSPARQRAAVRVGLRAARPTGQRLGLPVPLVGVLALAWASARAIATGLRIHLAALVAAAGVVTAGAVAVAVIPHLHSAPGGGHPAAGGVPAPASVPAHSARQPTQGTQHGSLSSAQPSPSVVPIASRSSALANGGSTPGPVAALPSPSAPVPLPSPSPSGAGGGGVCLDLLGIWVCL
jgi:hypothetical protein